MLRNLKSVLLKGRAPTKERVFFPVEVNTDRLIDWKEKQSENLKIEDEYRSDNQLESGTLVNVNNTEIALFKYGESIIATEAKCPHAGGPLHLGEIEVLHDKSLCVVCPWHMWAFCVSSQNDAGHSKVGSCLFPEAGRRKTLQVFPTEVSKSSRKHIKIGFDSIKKSG